MTYTLFRSLRARPVTNPIQLQSQEESQDPSHISEESSVVTPLDFSTSSPIVDNRPVTSEQANLIATLVENDTDIACIVEVLMGETPTDSVGEQTPEKDLNLGIDPSSNAPTDPRLRRRIGQSDATGPGDPRGTKRKHAELDLPSCGEGVIVPPSVERPHLSSESALIAITRGDHTYHSTPKGKRKLVQISQKMSRVETIVGKSVTLLRRRWPRPV